MTQASSSFDELWDISSPISAGDAVFFIGAGMSANSGLPTWDMLADSMRSRLSPPTAETDPILIAQFFRNQFGERALHQLLRSHLSKKALIPSNAHKALISLPVTAFFTTNFDHLLEDSLRAAGIPVHVITQDRELGLWDEKNETQVVKVHGDLDSSSSIVLTDEDYIRFLSQNTAIQRRLLETFAYRSVYFLGYSMRDPYISHIYNRTLTELGELKRPAYMFTFETDYHLHMELERRHVHVVQVPMLEGRTRGDSLAAFLESLNLKARSPDPARGCDVLLVDDEPLYLKLMTANLASEFPQLRTESALDGLSASMMVGKLRPAVVLVDIMMPGMDGFSLIAHIRADRDLAKTRIVVVSARGDSAERERALQLGADEYIVKPFRMADLVDAIRRVGLPI